MREFGLPLAKVRVGLATALRRSLVDLCDPHVLARLGITPDRIVARSRDTSQGVARTVLTSSAPGFRWWSAFFGEWHGLVIFLRRLEGAPLEFGSPRLIERDDPDLERALEALGMELGPPIPVG